MLPFLLLLTFGEQPAAGAARDGWSACCSALLSKKLPARSRAYSSYGRVRLLAKSEHAKGEHAKPKVWNRPGPLLGFACSAILSKSTTL